MTRFPSPRPDMGTNTEPAGNAGALASPAALRDAFDSRLADLVDADSLGVFILALANASFESSSFEKLRPAFAAAFGAWCERLDVGDESVRAAPADDVAVLRRLRDLGFDRLASTRRRQVGCWELQFNQMRALRPPRMSHAVVRDLYRPFDPEGFHFNRPFLRKEIFWEGELEGVPVRLLYNKFPFAELHGLLVPYPADCRPQYLSEESHRLAGGLIRRLGRSLPGVGFGYNARGAYASVNHLHFQMFLRSGARYPIESPHWQHNGGTRPYPLPARHFSDAHSAWGHVQRLHETGTAYNLLYRPDGLYVVERAMQGSYEHSCWTGGFAWSELAGSITTSDAEAFAQLREGDLEAEFLAVRP